MFLRHQDRKEFIKIPSKFDGVPQILSELLYLYA